MIPETSTPETSTPEISTPEILPPESGSLTVDTPPSGQVKPVILAVDDEPSNILALYELLKEDYDIRMATTGGAALQFCQRHLPDLILLDISLPDIDGYAVCRQLKSDASLCEVPVIFVTARDDPAAETQAFDEGGVDFISKPFHERVVRARVRTQLALKAHADRLRALATTDGLTGLANRRRFDEALAAEWARARREGSPLSLLMIDVDCFKAYNDRYGHQEGDTCLQAIARLLSGMARRPGDLAARYGGEEMALLLPRSEAEAAEQIAATFHRNLTAAAMPHAGNCDCGGIVTVSIGLATIKPTPHADPAALIVAADAMLYEAKRTGRNKTMTAPAQQE